MGTDAFTPKFFSVEFHAKFFPRLLRERLRRDKNTTRGTAFVSTTEMIITLAVCLILAVLGLPSALTRGSIVGWILSIIGVGGIFGLLIMSVGSQWGVRPTYDDFLTGIFFFFITLGTLTGIPVGMEKHSALLGLCASIGGLVTGYVLGILAGLWAQQLGWMASILNMLAGFAAIVLGGTILIMLFILTLK